MPSCIKALLDEYLQAANLIAGKLFRLANKNGSTRATVYLAARPAPSTGAPHRG